MVNSNDTDTKSVVSTRLDPAFSFFAAGLYMFELLAYAH